METQGSEEPQRARVLVVDDEANARHALVELLEDAGYDATAAADGEEALALLDRFSPDVVLTDVRMGEMSGLELGEQIRGRPDAPGIAFMSAFPPPRPVPQPWLPKPLDLDAVLTAIQRLFEARRAQLPFAAGR